MFFFCIAYLTMGLLDLKKTTFFSPSVQCPTVEYPWRAQPQNIPAVPQRNRIPTIPNCRISQHCPTAVRDGCSATTEYPAQRRSIPAVPKRRASLHAEPAPNMRVSPTAEYPCSAQRHSIPAVLQSLTLHCPLPEYYSQLLTSVPNPNVSLPAAPNLNEEVLKSNKALFWLALKMILFLKTARAYEGQSIFQEGS